MNIACKSVYQFLVHGFTCGLLKALTCAVDFIKIDCQSSLPIYASPKKLRCEPESSIDRPGAPGRCPRAGNSLPVSKRIPSGTTDGRASRPVRAAPEPRAGTHEADDRGIQPRPSRSRPGGRHPRSSRDFHRPLQAWIYSMVDLTRLNKPGMGRSTKCKVKKQMRPYAGAGFR